MCTHYTNRTSVPKLSQKLKCMKVNKSGKKNAHDKLKRLQDHFRHQQHKSFIHCYSVRISKLSWSNSTSAKWYVRKLPSHCNFPVVYILTGNAFYILKAKNLRHRCLLGLKGRFYHSCQPPKFTCRDMLLYTCATPTSLPTLTSKFSNKTKIMGVVEIWIVSLVALSCSIVSRPHPPKGGKGLGTLVLILGSASSAIIWLFA